MLRPGVGVFFSAYNIKTMKDDGIGNMLLIKSKTYILNVLVALFYFLELLHFTG